jgi:t-SNARE complex subunit (syntaxin)
MNENTPLIAAHNNELELQNAIIGEINDELAEVVVEAREINGMFRSVHEYVAVQGELLDNIDTNIHISYGNVVDGKRDLQKAKVYQGDGSTNTCFFALICCFVIVIIILLVMLAMRQYHQSVDDVKY